jgi:uncharacterized repeat protein (TIGR01451 family)
MSRLPRLSWIFCIALFLGVAIDPTSAHCQDEPLTLSATATPDPVRPSGEITFVFTITNRSGEEVSGVELQTTVPAHVESFPGESDDASGYFCNEGFAGTMCDPGETMKWNLGTLPDGQSQSATFAVIVKSGDEAPPEEAGISSSGSVTSDNTGGGSASVGVTAVSNPAFSLYVTGSKSSVSPGQGITYALSYGNSTDEPQSNVVLQAPVPSGASFVSASGGGIEEDGQVRWTIGEVGPEEIGRRTFTIQADSDLSDGEVLSSLATIESSGGNEARSGMATAVQQDTPLSLEASAEPDPAQPGGQVQFTITATNQSGTELTGLVIRTTVPGYVESFPGESDDASGYFCNEGFAGTMCDPGEVMKWEFDTLPDGQSQSATFSAQLLSGSSAPPENTAISTGATFTADGVGGGGTTASVLASTASYQIQETADGRFRTSLNEEDSTYAVTVQLKADPGESDLGTSTVRVGYNQLALEYNTVSFSNYDGTQLSFTGGTVTYSSNVTQPDPGVIALNITKESSTDGNGQALTNEWADVATLTFDIMDRSAMSRLNWPEQDIYNRLGEPDGEYQRGTFTESNETLPVELARLTADVSRSAVRLEWQTASEQNNAGFEVQRKEESGWNQIGYVESKASGGTTTEAQSYRYTATDLSVGTHQFRLKQVDLDGSSQVHGPINVDVQMQEALKLTAPAPNPVSSTATLSFAVKEQAEATVAVYDLLGRRVQTLYGGTPTPGQQQRVQMDASTLPSGAYLLRLRAAGRTETQRVTVLR